MIISDTIEKDLHNCMKLRIEYVNIIIAARADLRIGM